jgi:uncharacterized protein YndB with AHSA1/START domain
VADQRIVLAGAMAMDGRRFSTSMVTVELVANGGGTELVCTHQGAFFEGSDGPQMRQDGWKKLLERLGTELSL